MQRSTGIRMERDIPSGGNGEVLLGQTSCYTPMVYDLDPRTSYAFGVIYMPSTGEYIRN